MLYSALDSKYVGKWELFEQNTVNQWRKHLSNYGPILINSIYIDGVKGFQVDGRIPGNEHGTKDVTLVYVPLGEEFFLETHYTRNSEGHNASKDTTFDIVLSTLKLGKR